MSFVAFNEVARDLVPPLPPILAPPSRYAAQGHALALCFAFIIQLGSRGACFLQFLVWHHFGRPRRIFFLLGLAFLARRWFLRGLCRAFGWAGRNLSDLSGRFDLDAEAERTSLSLAVLSSEDGKEVRYYSWKSSQVTVEMSEMRAGAGGSPQIFSIDDGEGDHTDQIAAPGVQPSPVRTVHCSWINPLDNEQRIPPQVKQSEKLPTPRFTRNKSPDLFVARMRRRQFAITNTKLHPKKEKRDRQT